MGQHVESWKCDSQLGSIGKTYLFTGNYTDHISACGSSCKTGGKDRAEDKWIQLEKSISHVHSVFCDRIYNHNDLYQSGRKCGSICTVKGPVQNLHYHGYGGDRLKQQ